MKKFNIFNILITFLIFFSVVLVILESNNEFMSKNNYWLYWVNIFIYIIFIIEFIINIYNKRWKGLFIDFVAIAPFIFPFLSIDLRILRLLRLFRILKIFQLPAYKRSIALFLRVFLREKEILVITLIMSMTLVLFASIAMWYVEYPAQPDIFSDIATTMWWAITTLTTVGYGDMYPITTLGRLLSSLVSILGIGLIAVPSGIISAGFIAEYQEEKNAKETRSRYRR